MHIAMFIPSLTEGGVARIFIRLSKALADKGHRVDLVVCNLEGPYKTEAPKNVNLIALRCGSTIQARLKIFLSDVKGLSIILKPILLPFAHGRKLSYLTSLTDYLKKNRPDCLFSANPHANLLSLWARRISRVSTRVIVSERNTLSQKIQSPSKRHFWRWRYLPRLINRMYMWADNIHAVSEGVANDLSKITSIPRKHITVIYNPVIDRDLEKKVNEPIDHVWFIENKYPIILGIGRLAEQKDFETLLRAFAKVKEERATKLVVLGEGPKRKALQELAYKLDIKNDVDFTGWVPNPCAYLAKASVFVLSSRFEGLPGVLIEALACGCPIVSTNCPSGPSEILRDGVYGKLVPVADETSMAKAILDMLNSPIAADKLRQRANEFSIENITNKYIDMFSGKS